MSFFCPLLIFFYFLRFNITLLRVYLLWLLSFKFGSLSLNIGFLADTFFSLDLFNLENRALVRIFFGLVGHMNRERSFCWEGIIWRVGFDLSLQFDNWIVSNKWPRLHILFRYFLIELYISFSNYLYWNNLRAIHGGQPSRR